MFQLGGTCLCRTTYNEILYCYRYTDSKDNSCPCTTQHSQQDHMTKSFNAQLKITQTLIHSILRHDQHHYIKHIYVEVIHMVTHLALGVVCHYVAPHQFTMKALVAINSTLKFKLPINFGWCVSPLTSTRRNLTSLETSDDSRDGIPDENDNVDKLIQQFHLRRNAAKKIVLDSLNPLNVNLKTWRPRIKFTWGPISGYSSNLDPHKT